MPNLYKSKAMKKYVNHAPDPIKDITGIKINSRSLICGLAGSGKTNCLMQFILTCNGVFDKIYLCYKTDEPFYELLIDQLKKDDLIEVFKTVESFYDVNYFEDEENFLKRKETPPRYLVIFDDCINDCKKGKLNFKMREFFTYGRKKCLTIFFLAQSYYQTEKYFRDQMNYLILTSIASNKDLKAILKEYQLGNLSVDLFLKAFKWIKDQDKENDLDFMKIDLHGNCSDDKKISRNFIEFLPMETLNNL